MTEACFGVGFSSLGSGRAHHDEAAAESVRKLVSAGALGRGVLATEDCRRSYEELKARGVTFLREPKEMPYGIEAVLRDDSGNFFSLTQHQR